MSVQRRMALQPLIELHCCIFKEGELLKDLSSGDPLLGHITIKEELGNLKHVPGPLFFSGPFLQGLLQG